MKKSNKLIILSACIFIVSFAFVISALYKTSSDGGSAPPKRESTYIPLEENTLEAENNVSESVTDKEDNKRYVIKISNSKICAYMISDNGSLILWNGMDIPPAISREEKEILLQGIYTDSFEEMCLYFESYAS